MEEVFQQIKEEFEAAIKIDGKKALGLIRSQKLIKRVHEKVSKDLEELIEKQHPNLFEKVIPMSSEKCSQELYNKFGVCISSEKIFKLSRKELLKNIYDYKNFNRETKESIKNFLSNSLNEVKVYGAFKTKDQDITILPKSLDKNEERLNDYSYLNDLDPYGGKFTEKMITINIRSQNSSLNKNFDTMYERTLAEAVNLHMRCPSMVLGDIYCINLTEYDSGSLKNKQIKYNKINPDILVKYIKSFKSLTSRERTSNNNVVYDPEKYERIALVLVDFSRNPVKIYSDYSELVKDGFLKGSSSPFDPNYINFLDLSYEGFLSALFTTYINRFSYHF